MNWVNALLPSLDKTFGKDWSTVLFTNVFALLFAALFLWLCAKLARDGHERFQNYLIVSFGALIGWALGMFFAPYGANDQPVFAQMGKLASVFLSGYALSKLDRFIEASMFDGKTPKIAAWVRTGLFAGALVLALLTVVTNRLYYRPDDSPEKSVSDIEVQGVQAVAGPFLGSLFSVVDTPVVSGDHATVRTTILNRVCHLTLDRHVGSNSNGWWVVSKSDCAPA